MLYELNHFGIVVRDLQRSMHFYEDRLGGKVVFRATIPSNLTEIVYLQIAGSIIELVAPAEHQPDTRLGITHVGFLTDDLNADYDRLVGAGFEGLIEPRPAGSGVGRQAFLNDPNGAQVELIQRDLRMRQPVAPHPVVASFDHFAIRANDEAAALHFYRDLLGMEVLTSFEVPSSRQTSTYLSYGTDVLELLHFGEPDEDAPVFSHIALTVENLEDALALFAEAGILPEPGTPRAAVLGHVAVIRDPDDVRIELLDRADIHIIAARRQ